MSRWFRVYDDVINDPKIIKLPEETRWHWIAILCIASKNGGVLPSTEDVGISLRIKTSAAATVIATLKTAGLLDQREDGRFVPHNWDGRQFKSDVSTDRVKRFRKRERNVSSTVSETAPETDTETDTESEQNRTEQIDDVAVEASGALVTPEALNLSEKLLVIAGHDPKFWPPGWCGAPMRVQTWLSQGWPAEIIVAAVKGVAARKRGPPANSVQFFENAIAEEVARQSAPLPTVEIKPASNLVVTHGSNQIRPNSSLTDSIRRELAELERSESADFEVSARPVLRISG